MLWCSTLFTEFLPSNNDCNHLAETQLAQGCAGSDIMYYTAGCECRAAVCAFYVFHIRMLLVHQRHTGDDLYYCSALDTILKLNRLVYILGNYRAKKKSTGTRSHR